MRLRRFFSTLDQRRVIERDLVLRESHQAEAKVSESARRLNKTILRVCYLYLGSSATRRCDVLNRLDERHATGQETVAGMFNLDHAFETSIGSS